MNSSIERLLSLRVGDIMTRNVVQVPSHETMADAARLFAKHQVSGAPVVDEEGRCVGILSSADFVIREYENIDQGRGPASGVDHVLVQDRPGGPYHVEDVGEDMVSNHMTPAIQTTTASTPILEAARILCGEHIHRLVVLDDRGRPSGLISSLDLVAALIKAVEE